MVLSGSFFKIKEKYWELEALRECVYWQWLAIHFSINRKCDHAGLRLFVEIIGLSLEIKIYDCRHWNYKKDAWYVDGEEESEEEEDNLCS